jgi:hypothetical protein
LAETLQPDTALLPPNIGSRPIQQQAFAFSQLGVLGMVRPTVGEEVAGPAATVAAMGRATAANPATTLERTAPAFGTAAPGQVIANSATASLARVVGVPTAFGEIAGENAPAGLPTTPSSRILTADIQSADEAASVERAVLQPPGREVSTTALAAPTVSVIVTPDGDSIQVLASAPGVTADARNRLVEALLRAGDEFGLSLSEVRLNGVSMRVRSGAEQGRLR